MVFVKIFGLICNTNAATKKVKASCLLEGAAAAGRGVTGQEAEMVAPLVRRQERFTERTVCLLSASAVVKKTHKLT